MSKYTKEYFTPYIPGINIVRTSQIADLRSVVSLEFRNNKVTTRLKHRYYRKTSELHILSTLNDLPNTYGELVVKYEPYRSMVV